MPNLFEHTSAAIIPSKHMPSQVTLRVHRYTILAAMMATSIGSIPSFAQDGQSVPTPQAPQAPGLESINDARSSNGAATAFEPPVIEGSLELDLRQTEAQDADGILSRDTGRVVLELTLDIEQALGRHASMEARLELAGLHFTESRLDSSIDTTEYNLERLFLQLDPNPSLRIRIGRQELEDSMETIVSEDLDGVQLVYERGRVELELSLTREDLFEASSVDRQDDITNTMASAQFEFNKDTVLIPYVLHRSEQSFNGSIPSDTTWAGFQLISEHGKSNWSYWLHGMGRTGDEDTSSGSEDLSGVAIDAGVGYSARGLLDSTFTLGIAHADGGSRSERFRQSGLHSNDFALNGKNSFRYLGEVFDPELTNIQILTLGWGAEPYKQWRTDVALHSYQQVEAEDSLRGADIEFQPTGNDTDLGIAGDIIISYKHSKALEIQGTAGRFIPGDAFDGDRDDAWLARLEIEYNF